MTRTTTPQQADVLISVPPQYTGKKLEVPLYAVKEIIEEAPKPTTMAQFCGILSKDAADDVMRRAEESRNELH